MLNLFKNHKLKKLGGLNNKNYLIDYYNNFYVLRLPNKDNSNDFLSEHSILSLVNSKKLSPHIIYHNKENGILLTKYLDNSAVNINTLTTRNFLKSLSISLKKLHNLEALSYFDPFKDIEDNFKFLKKNNFKFNHDIDIFIEKMNFLKVNLTKNISLGLCHNDLNISNVLFKNSEVKFIDFEFSGMNDIFFDLATISWFLSDHLRNYLIFEYFGYTDKEKIKKLNDYLFIVKLWNASWSLKKSLTSNSDYDYVLGANMILDDIKNYKIF